MESASKERIARSAGRISGATVISRILGLARDSIFAALFAEHHRKEAIRREREQREAMRRMEVLLRRLNRTVAMMRLHNQRR